MPGLGLGLGLGLTSNSGAPRHGAAETIKTAIGRRVRVKAKQSGKSLVMEPYALFRADGITMLNAVVIYSEAKRVRKFKPQDFDLAALDEVTVTEDTFFPNWAFNANTLPPEIIVAVELVQYGQNAEKTASGSDSG